MDTTWSQIRTFHRKFFERGSALTFMWLSGGISFRLLVSLGIILTTAAVLLGVSAFGAILLVLTMLLCAGLEVLNTMLEILIDVVKPQRDERIRHLKDLAGTLPALVALAYLIMWLFFVFGT